MHPGSLAVLDHLVYAGPDLPALVAGFTERSGVRPAPGGKHPGGSANYLVAFTIGGERVRSYLELVGPDPDRTETTPVELFGISRLRHPALVAFAVAPADVDATAARARDGGYDPGPLEPLSRRTPRGDELHWRLSPPARHSPLIPFLIDWGHTPHPALGDIPAVELLSLRGYTPEPERTGRVLELLGVDLPLQPGPRDALRARMHTPAGELELT